MSLDPNHAQKRAKLQKYGRLFLAVAVLFWISAAVASFTSPSRPASHLASEDTPQSMEDSYNADVAWMDADFRHSQMSASLGFGGAVCFILGVGATVIGNMGAIMRYQLEETVPVAKDAVKDIVSSLDNNANRH